MTRIVTDAADFWDAKAANRVPKPPGNGWKCGAFPRFSPNLCQSVKLVDVFLRNLRNLWFLLTEAEQLPRGTETPAHYPIGAAFLKE